MFERMRFSRLRRSRLTLVLIGVLWLPYVSVCCVVAPFGGAEARAACCPTLGNSMRMHHSDIGSGSAPVVEHVDSHDARLSHAVVSRRAGGDLPARDCCELTGEFHVAVQSNTDPGAHVGAIASARFEAAGSRIVLPVGGEPLTDSQQPRCSDQ